MPHKSHLLTYRLHFHDQELAHSSITNNKVAWFKQGTLVKQCYIILTVLHCLNKVVAKVALVNP